MPTPPLTFHKVNALPPFPVADGMYFIKVDEATMRLVVTDASGDPLDLQVDGSARHYEIFPEGEQWIVNHNFGYRPASVQLLTTGGVEFEAYIVHTSVNQFVVNLSPPTAGQVIVQ